MLKDRDILKRDPAAGRENLLFAFACAVLILMKYMLVSLLPISPRPSYRTDDLLMVLMARGIMSGKWLGSYSYANLMKGCFFPLFLTATHQAGISYLSALDLLNSAAALYLPLSVRTVLRRRRWMLILLAVLLFNPINASELTFERVYRCSITSMQTLFLFGSVFAAYLDRKNRPGRQVLRAVFCGFVLWSIWNTREDALWVVPFLLVAGIVMLAGRLKGQRKWYRIVCSVILFLMPFLVLAGGNAALAAINQNVYGLPVRNETEAGFGELLKTMYSIKNREHIEHVSVSAEKLERMYGVSPTLRKIEPELTKHLQQADTAADRANNDGEVEDGWFLWCVKRAVESSGVGSTLPEADAFYRQAAKELKEAIANPENGFETQWVMPSALISPWQEGYERKLPAYLFEAAKYLISYREVSAVPRIVDPSVERMSYLFEAITGNASIHSEEQTVGQYRQIYIDRADAVASVYRAVNPFAAILAAVLFITHIVLALIRRDSDEIPWLLVAAGTGLSIVVLLAGIAYTDMTAFIAIRYTYMGGGYSLMLAFEWIVILRSADRVYEFLKRKRGAAR